MSYSTLDDIKKLIPADILIQLTDDENTGAVVASRIDEAVAQADAEVNAYCATKFTVPFAPVPVVIRKLSVDLAIYNLYSRRVEIVPETRSERYKNAVRTLEGIAKGTVALDVAPMADPPANTDENPKNTRSADDRVFTKTNMEGF
jgi:phage gp36-like protein